MSAAGSQGSGLWAMCGRFVGGLRVGLGGLGGKLPETVVGSCSVWGPEPLQLWNSPSRVPISCPPATEHLGLWRETKSKPGPVLQKSHIYEETHGGQAQHETDWTEHSGVCFFGSVFNNKKEQRIK